MLKVTPDQKSFTVAVPKPLVHPADIQLRKVTRQILPDAEFATGGDYEDKLRLTFTTEIHHLRQAISAVKRVHPHQSGVPAEVIQREIVGRKKLDRSGAKVVIKAIRHDQGGRL